MIAPIDAASANVEPSEKGFLSFAAGAAAPSNTNSTTASPQDTSAPHTRTGATCGSSVGASSSSSNVTRNKEMPDARAQADSNRDGEPSWFAARRAREYHGHRGHQRTGSSGYQRSATLAQQSRGIRSRHRRWPPAEPR